MNQQQIIDDLSSLTLEAQRQIVDFIAVLKTHYAPSRVAKRTDVDLSKEKFVGMWQDRADLSDSSAWVRSNESQQAAPAVPAVTASTPIDDAS